MFVFEITIPGTWLDYEDRIWSSKIENLLASLERHFFEANLALNLFIDVQLVRQSRTHRDSWQRDSQRQEEIRRVVEQERGVSMAHSDWAEIHHETEIRFKREQWASGRLPFEFEHKQPFIYARAFLYALDGFEKFHAVLAKEQNVPPQVSEYYAQIAAEFPHLREVRNTSQHLEDRTRGLGRGTSRLDLKPVTNDFIHAPAGGVLILDNLNGSKFGATMADGHFGEIDVSCESMRRLQNILQNVLKAFKWKGPPRHAPAL